MTTKRIDLSLFDDNLKGLINASAKIFPMSLSDVQANLNPNLYEYVRIIDMGVHKNEIYIWNTTVFELIGADDKQVDFVQEVINKPTSYPNDLAHAHNNLSTLETITSILITSWNNAVTHISDVIKHITSVERTLWNTVTSKADATTTTTSLANKSDITHDHDGRYNTKAEVTSGLSGKSDTTHNHDSTYAAKGVETTVTNNSGLITGLRTDVNANTTSIGTIQTNMANGDMHSNIGILNQLSQILLDSWNSKANINSPNVGYLQAKGFVSDEIDTVKVMFPSGASSKENVGDVTGAIKIVLPPTVPNAMITMTIKVFLYGSNESFEIHCGGHNYSGINWINTTAYIVGNPKINKQFTLRFGYDATLSRLCIYIGELATVWNFPQITVTDVEIGYGQQLNEVWNDNWDVGFESSAFGTISEIIVASQVGFYENTLSSIKMNGIQSVGIENTLARGDHIHPNDTSKADKNYVDTQDALKVDSTTFTGHTGNSTIHVTQTDKDNFNAKSQIIQGTTEPISTSYWFKEV